MKSKMQLLTALLLAAALSVVPAIAHAQTTYPLTSDDCLSGCSNSSGPQDSSGNVVVSDLGGGMLSFSINLLNKDRFVNTGFPLTFAFDLARDPAITYLSLTAGRLIPNALPVNQQIASTALDGSTAYDMNGTGVLEYGVLWNTQGGAAGTPGSLSFEIAATGLTLSSIELSPGKNFFAVDILAGATVNTGVVDASLALAVPEPETYAMLLAGLGLIGFMVGRRRTDSLN